MDIYLSYLNNKAPNANPTAVVPVPESTTICKLCFLPNTEGWAR